MPSEKRIIENFTLNEWLLQFRYIIEKKNNIEKSYAKQKEDE